MDIDTSGDIAVGGVSTCSAILGSSGNTRAIIAKYTYTSGAAFTVSWGLRIGNDATTIQALRWTPTSSNIVALTGSSSDDLNINVITVASSTSASHTAAYRSHNSGNIVLH